MAGWPIVGAYLPWRAATEAALYGPAGFFRTGAGPAAHFRTSVHASPLFAQAVLTLLERVDSALGRPETIDLVDVGAGRGELLALVADAVPAGLARRLRLTGVELADRPLGLDPAIGWAHEIPPVTGLLFANEWLDNVPVDVVELDTAGQARCVLVEPATGEETLGRLASDAERAWLDRWWPLREPGDRAELGWPRDEAWSAAVSNVERGLAVAVDYGHVTDGRPRSGTLAGYRAGHQVPPVPDGSCDLTAHVAMDAVAEAGAGHRHLTDQRTALRALGVSGARPPHALASADPPAYLRALAAASQAGELLDPAGLGDFHWLAHAVAMPSGWPAAAFPLPQT